MKGSGKRIAPHNIQRAFSTPTEYAKMCPIDCYRFVDGNIKFGTQNCRVNGHKKSTILDEFTNGSFQFVYKNTAQIQASVEKSSSRNHEMLLHESLNDLNDTLFSHCFWADTGVQWDLLYAAVAHVPDDYNCPICYFSPVAPRLTRCGHIICADCLLQLFRESHDKIPLCPVCGEELTNEDYVRCMCIYHPAKVIGETITFTKVYRYASDNICFCNHGELNTLRPASDPLNRFTRFAVADKKFIDKVIKKELEELEVQKITYMEYDCPQKLSAIDKVMSDIQKEKAMDDHVHFTLGKHKEDERKVIFYQSNDGRLIFLNEFCRRMLVEQFGSLEKAPDSIEAKVINTWIEREKLLSHLPQGSECTNVFADLSNYLSPEVLERNRHEIKISTPVIKKKKEPKRVITEADFQLYMHEEQEPEVKLSSETEFPALIPSTVPMKNAVHKKTMEEEFPSFTSAASDFPSFDALTKPEPKRKRNKKPKKKSSVWASLNL